MELHLLPTDFVAGFLIGLFLMPVLIGVWFGIPALWSTWADGRATHVTVDMLLDLDRCDICLEPLTDDIEAITCDAHRYCGDCDDASNRCTACAYARRLTLIEERS